MIETGVHDAEVAPGVCVPRGGAKGGQGWRDDRCNEGGVDEGGVDGVFGGGGGARCPPKAPMVT